MEGLPGGRTAQLEGRAFSRRAAGRQGAPLKSCKIAARVAMVLCYRIGDERGHDSLARRAATTYLPVAGHLVECVGRGPDPALVLRQFVEFVGGRLFDHVCRHGYPVTPLVGVIVEPRPRCGRVLLADSQHPAE